MLKLARLWMVLICSGLCACSAAAPTILPTHSLAAPSPAETLRSSSSTAIPTRPPEIPLEKPAATVLSPIQPTCTRCPQPSASASDPTPSVSPTSTARPATVRLEKLDVWDDPAQEKSYWHLQTQLITGERVLVLAEKGEWAEIVAVEQPSSKDGRGYPGWVRKTGLAAGWSAAQEYLVVISRTTQARSRPDANSASLMRLYFDTRLPVTSAAGPWIETRLPDGRQVWLQRASVRLAANPSLPIPRTSLLETARSLENAPYQWGGTTSDSPDCSGFIYRLFHVFGIRLGRDADDQAAGYGSAVALKDIQPGDIIFYTDLVNGPVTHVGLYMGNQQIMDANPRLGLSIHALDDMSKYYVFHSIHRIE